MERIAQTLEEIPPESRMGFLRYVFDLASRYEPGSDPDIYLAPVIRDGRVDRVEPAGPEARRLSAWLGDIETVLLLI